MGELVPLPLGCAPLDPPHHIGLPSGHAFAPAPNCGSLGGNICWNGNALVLARVMSESDGAHGRVAGTLQGCTRVLERCTRVLESWRFRNRPTAVAAAQLGLSSSADAARRPCRCAQKMGCAPADTPHASRWGRRRLPQTPIFTGKSARAAQAPIHTCSHTWGTRT